MNSQATQAGLCFLRERNERSRQEPSCGSGVLGEKPRSSEETGELSWVTASNVSTANTLTRSAQTSWVKSGARNLVCSSVVCPTATIIRSEVLENWLI